MLILILALLGTAMLLVRPDRALALAERLPGRSVGLCSAGIAAELLGIAAGGRMGHGLVALGVGALITASWPLRQWRGGWLLIAGLALNGLAMALHGRMPMPPEVASQIGLAQQLGTVLEGKDVVAAGLAARWLGDRLIMAIPFVHYTIVWSPGDLLIICGICRAAIGQVRHAQFT
ncbi:MAG TPA: DUF5317 family protein [Roseiflexaceae bacterium]|nr:DUF5317 family protein [Roseiflexaceae bacterium]